MCTQQTVSAPKQGPRAGLLPKEAAGPEHQAAARAYEAICLDHPAIAHKRLVVSQSSARNDERAAIIRFSMVMSSAVRVSALRWAIGCSGRKDRRRVNLGGSPRRLWQGSIRQGIALPAISLALASGDHQRIAWRELIMADSEKTGRVIGTLAAIGVVICVARRQQPKELGSRAMEVSGVD